MKKSALKQTATEVTVGTFILMMLLLLGFFTIVLSRENIFVTYYDIDVTFDNVTGLLTGDKVYVQGVDVGRVKDMTINRKGVYVVLSLRYKPQFHQDYSISVQSSSILGGKYVAVSEGSDNAKVLPDKMVLNGKAPVDFVAELTETVGSVRSALEEGGVLDNLKIAMTNVEFITTKIKNGEGTLGKLVNDDSLYTNLQAIASSLKTITTKIDNGEGTIGKLVNDDSVYTNVQAIAANLNVVSERLADGKGTLGKLLSEDDSLYTNLAAAVVSIKDISARIDKGEGTLGKLTTDDALYNDLRKMIEEVRAGIDDLRETSPVSSFSGVFFGAF